MPTSRARVRRRRPAFALIAVLLLTALALVCAFGALRATASFERENENLVALGCARSAALAGAKIALADLQTYTGTDACATAKIVPSASASEWLGAWHGERIRQEFSSGAVPLVSARGVFAGTRSCFLRDAARMSAPAEVPWEKLGENVRFAYFILDESLRASAARREREAHLRRFGGDPETLARLRRQVPRNTHFAHFLDGETLPAALFPEKLAAAPDEKILLAALGDAVPRERRAAARETFTLDAQGVPADWPRRALKFDFFDEKNAAQDKKRTDRNGRNIGKLTDHVEQKTVFCGNVHLIEIRFFQRRVHAVEFALFELFVRKRTDQPHRVDIFLHGEVELRIVLADVERDAARRLCILKKRDEKEGRDNGGDQQHPCTVERQNHA